jgi:hypothetical protein
MSVRFRTGCACEKMMISLAEAGWRFTLNTHYSGVESGRVFTRTDAADNPGIVGRQIRARQ